MCYSYSILMFLWSFIFVIYQRIIFCFCLIPWKYLAFSYWVQIQGVPWSSIRNRKLFVCLISKGYSSSSIFFMVLLWRILNISISYCATVFWYLYNFSTLYRVQFRTSKFVRIYFLAVFHHTYLCLCVHLCLCLCMQVNCCHLASLETMFMPTCLWTWQ